MKLKIKISRQKTELNPFEIRNAECVVGRSKGHLILDDTFCSGSHARFYQGKDGHLIIEDLKSRNGTFVNGRRVAASRLQIGDKVQVGETVLTIQLYVASAEPENNVHPQQSANQDRTRPHVRARPKREVLQEIDPKMVVRKWPEVYDALPEQGKNEFVEHLDDELPDFEVPRKKTG